MPCCWTHVQAIFQRCRVAGTTCLKLQSGFGGFLSSMRIFWPQCGRLKPVLKPQPFRKTALLPQEVYGFLSRMSRKYEHTRSEDKFWDQVSFGPCNLWQPAGAQERWSPIQFHLPRGLVSGYWPSHTIHCDTFDGQERLKTFHDSRPKVALSALLVILCWSSLCSATSSQSASPCPSSSPWYVSSWQPFWWWRWF